MATMLQTANAIRNILISESALGLTEDTCSIDLDTAMLSMMQVRGTRACLVLYGGGAKENRQQMQLSGGGGSLTQRGDIWRDRWNCLMLVRYEDDSMQIEIDTLEIIDTLKSMMAENRRLGNLVPKADIVQIGQPDAADINDTPFYLIPFSIEVMTKS